MKILYVCTELYPLLKTGGLADVGAALPAALQTAGCHVRLLLPAFAAIAAGVRADSPTLPLPDSGGPDVLRTLQPAPRLIPGHVIESGQPVYLLDAQRINGKTLVKRTLQRLLGLEERADALLFAAVTRLTEQKGLHLLPAILPELIECGGQLVILGSGDDAIETALREALAGHPGQATLRIGYDEALAHCIIAAADVILVPSRFEPCGLTQLYGLRYGALPLVHAVGGLADTITDCSLEAIDDGSASGFAFHEFSAEALRGAMRRAFALRRRPSYWSAVQRHAMQQRFDWQGPAQAYRALYQQLLVPAVAPGSTVLS